MSAQYRCPICDTALEYVARYPRYICRECARRASDANGRRVEFFNEDLSGGFVGRYADTHESYSDHTCYVDGIECWADEAHFGGIVIQATRHGTRT